MINHNFSFFSTKQVQKLEDFALVYFEKRWDGAKWRIKIKRIQLGAQEDGLELKLDHDEKAFDADNLIEKRKFNPECNGQRVELNVNFVKNPVRYDGVLSQLSQHVHNRLSSEVSEIAFADSAVAASALPPRRQRVVLDENDKR